MSKREPTWLDAHHGWDESGNVVDTYWIGDPAVDADKSDVEAYFRSFDAAHLVVKPGQQPVRMVIRLPEPVQWAEIQHHMGCGLPIGIGLHRAAIVAFELCVRFPESPAAEPEYRYGADRLPQALLRTLDMSAPSIFARVGSWIINRYALTDEEKKASSPESGAKTSANSSTTTAADATRSGSSSKGARTSGRKRTRKQKTA